MNYMQTQQQANIEYPKTCMRGATNEKQLIHIYVVVHGTGEETEPGKACEVERCRKPVKWQAGVSLCAHLESIRSTNSMRKLSS